MTPAIIDPATLIVLGVVHDLEHVQDAPGVVHTADQTVAIVAHIEDHAVAYQVSRLERLPERPEVRPIRVLGQLAPGRKVSLRDPGVGASRLPVFT